MGYFNNETPVPVTHDDAERISQDILYKNDDVLAATIIDRQGKILAFHSKESFKKDFGEITNQDKTYGGILFISILSLINEIKHIIDESRAIISIHKNCKMMLIPLQSHQIVVALVLQRSVNAEDFLAAHKIDERLPLR